MGKDNNPMNIVSQHSPSHDTSIEGTPQGAPQTETRTSNDWKCDVVYCAGSRVQNYKWGYNAIPQPDTDPGLPP